MTAASRDAQPVLPSGHPSAPGPLFALVVGFVWVALSFWFQGDIGLDLADEGFLWYGSLRTLAGEVPLRDFQAYDPGRYYWCAVGSAFMGPGVLAVRGAAAFFQALGLVLGLLTLRRVIRSRGWLAVAGGVLLIWMFPRHKVFEHALALAAVYFATSLAESPTATRHLVAGLFTGLAAVFGRNHGVYAAVALTALMAYLRVKLRPPAGRRAFGAWAAGVTIGFLPVVVMAMWLPGFCSAFWESIARMFRLQATNLPLPVPWPWLSAAAPMAWSEAAAVVDVSLLFVMVPLGYLVAGIHLVRLKSERLAQQAPVVGAVFIGTVYLHLMFSRPDAAHMAQAIAPFLVLVLSTAALARRGGARGSAALLCLALAGLSLFPALRHNPLGGYLRAAPGNYVRAEVCGDRLRLPVYQADALSAVTGAFDRLATPDEGVFIAPHSPGLYPILGRHSAVWEIYFLAPAPEKRQRKMIERMERDRVNWAILGDIGMDGREALKLRNTHALVWRYLQEAFEPVDVAGLPPGHQLRRRVHTGADRTKF